ncbi:family 43 glycosylhydrolase [Microbacterium phyllosphaerae]|uniref:family 43 glycosylhydrolase n=1 Tax=Microbacterium phyllosphaerae TaxID=124798 RepID=UPI003D65B13D
MSGTIRTGELVTDDRGRIAQLHGIGIQRVGPHWYAWGEDKTAGDRFTAVACYRSADLATWEYVGDALAAGSGDLSPDRIVERPKALRRPDGRWVLIVHIENADYSDARVGFAIGDAPEGPYEYLGSERPLGNLSRDIGVYHEGGVGYLLSEDRDNGLHIYRLRPDYCGVQSIVATLRQQDRPEIGYESPTLVRHDGLYYVFGSDLTGWDLNDNKYATASALEGPWSPWRDFAPTGSRTFDSQVSVVLPVDGGHVYIGDRWDRDDLASSAPIWLPLRVEEGRAELSWRDDWSIEELKK